ncbi:MAG: cytosine-specific methyltransferase [Fimbriimonadales bacterium]|nr:MAG: cytosine-specific methyltransferase [Fimbriimonadales bacterium]
MRLRFVDLFCGIGGFHLGIRAAAEALGVQAECVMACDIDAECRKMYLANFGFEPQGDVRQIPAESVPPHDVLLAGFPCQPFSIIGRMSGLADTRGTLFFEIARLLDACRPPAFVLENVKMLRNHRRGQTLARILSVLSELGYSTSHRILNALDFGLPQKRERLFIVGFREPMPFAWPSGRVPMTPLREILEQDVPPKYYASAAIVESRRRWHEPDDEPTIWHENKAGNVSKYPFSCALRANASYNYLLVNGERRLTEREMLRLQGFPDNYKIVCSYAQVRKQAGNAVPVPVVREVLVQVIRALDPSATSEDVYISTEVQPHLVMDGRPSK